MKTASEIQHLIHLLSKLPGLGPRSARRMSLELLKKKQELMIPLGQSLLETAEKLTICPECGNWDVISPCSLCSDSERKQTVICVVEDLSDLWAVERTNMFHGVYHILGGKLSPIDGVGPDELRIPKLLERIEKNQIIEVILALNATLEGQTTMHYIKESLQGYGCKVTQLAHGVPVGGELDYIDDGTLSLALKSRSEVA